MAEGKSPVLSKGLWTGLAISLFNGLSAFFPVIGDYVNPTVVNTFMGFVVMAVRVMTKGAIKFW